MFEASSQTSPITSASGFTALAAERGLTVRIGSECEFYMFEADERGNITTRPQDRAGYMDVSPLDRGEDVRREISLTLSSMNTSSDQLGK